MCVTIIGTPKYMFGSVYILLKNNISYLYLYTFTFIYELIVSITWPFEYILQQLF